MLISDCEDRNCRHDRQPESDKYDEYRKIIDGLDNVLYRIKRNTLLEGANYLVARNAEVSKCPLVLLEGAVNDCGFWMRGIRKVMNCITSKPTVVITQSVAIDNAVMLRPDVEVKPTSLKTLIKRLQSETDNANALVVVVLDAVNEEEDVSNILQQLSLYTCKVSVVIPIRESKRLDTMCSEDVLLQFEKLVLKMGPSEALLPQIMSYMTFEKKSVIEFSPYVLQMLRCSFLLNGYLETARDNVKTATIMHLMVGNKKWTQEAKYEFSHLVSTYWRIVKHLAIEIQVSVAEIHTSLQNDSKLFIGYRTPIHLKISNWFGSSQQWKAMRLANLLIDVCESEDMLVVRVFKLELHYKQMKYYLNLRKNFVSVESTFKKICILNEKMCMTFLQPFITFPNGKEFVSKTRMYEERSFFDYQLKMESALMEQDDNCGACYRVLRVLKIGNLIVMKDWARGFFQKVNVNESPVNWAVFSESVYVLENCGVVSSSSVTDEGTAVVSLKLHIF